MRITGRQLRQIIKEEVTRSLVREESTGGLNAARELEMDPYTSSDGRRPIFVKGLYSDAAKRLVDDAAEIVDHLEEITDGASSSKTGSLGSRMTDVVLNRPRGQAARDALKVVLTANTPDEMKFLSMVYILATGDRAEDVSNNLNASTILLNGSTMLAALGLPVGAGDFGRSLDELNSYIGTTTFMDDMKLVLTRPPPANLK